MEITTLEPLLKVNPFFEGMRSNQISALVGCATNLRFNHGDYLFRAGQKAERFFVIREGQVHLRIPGKQEGSIDVSLLNEGDVLGWSWLFPPFKWQFDARAEGTVRVIALDADCVNAKCEKDPVLGYELMKRFALIVTDRLQSTRRKLVEAVG